MQDMFPVTRRLCQIVWAVLRFYVVPSLRPGKPASTSAERLRHVLEYVGGAWLKLGQALALRFDLLPPEYCTEFQKLLNEAMPFPYAAAREVVREELGQYPEELFASFDPVPIAAASIAQVHKATSLDGVELAVKIQRPTIQRQFAADFRIMRVFSYGFDLAGVFGGRSFRAFIDESARWTREEINFRNEARNGHRMSLFSADDPFHVDAKVRFEYSTERILTTEFMHGICLLDIVRAIRNKDDAYLGELTARGYDPAKIARRISWNFLNQLLRDNFFHADPHPANIFVLPDNVIGYLDFGIASRLSRELQDAVQNYTRCLLDGDVDRAAAAMIRMTTPSASTNLEQARQDLTIVVEEYLQGSGGAEARSPLQLTAGIITKNLAVLRRNRMAMSEELGLYFKAVLTTDSIVFELAPDYDLFSDLKTFFEASARMDAMELLDPNRLPQKIVAAAYQASQSLADVGRLQETGRSLEIWLETLQTRLAMYGFWAIMLGVGAYIVYQDERFAALQATLGIGQRWVAGGLLIVVVAILAIMWRRGREINSIDRRPSGRADPFDRSVDRFYR